MARFARRSRAQLMRIAYHSDTFARKARFGLSRYSHSLRDALAAQGVATMPFSSQSDFASDPPAWLEESGFRRLALPRKLLAPVWTCLGLPRAEWLLPEFDILHSIDVDYRAPTGKPWVVTIHDLGPLAHPEFFSEARPWLLRAYVRQIARRADRIICVSQSTANEVAAFAKVPLGDRLVVVDEGVEAKFFEAPSVMALEESEAIIPKGVPFLLFSGSRNPRKNLAGIIAAFAKVASGIPHHLVIAGSIGWGPDLSLDRVRDGDGSARIHAPGYVSDEVLRALLWRASAYLYLSLYEGFGLPILEAMASGCPVLTSDNSSMPEVAGDAALLVNAGSVDAMAEAISSAVQDSSLLSVLKARGLARAGEFTWEKTAIETRNIYRYLV